METKESTIITPPPRLIPAFIAGFNAIANHIGIILIPIMLDFFIWFGPKLRLEALLTPVIDQANQTLGAYNGSDMSQMLASAQEAWAILIQRINLTNSLATFPLGIPSLLSATDVQETPLGLSPTVEISSFGLALFVFLGLVLTGLFLGTIYIQLIARSTDPTTPQWTFSAFWHQLINLYALVLILILAVIIILIPSLFIISIVALFSPALSQIVFLIFTFILLWLLVPMVFSPHGIFTSQLSVIKSILTSIRMVRFFLPGTGLFILAVVILAQGLDLLWLAPPVNSWLMVVGIAGHAFIYTSLLAASFVFYRQGNNWMKENLAKLNQMLKV